MKIITTEKLPIKMWLEDIEDGALEQAKNLANLPFAFKHVAIMPDSHQGYGMPIGGVLATKGVIIPNAVGVDIGCGMCAVKTSLTEISQDDLKEILGKIRKAIPVGMNRHKEEQDYMLMPLNRAGEYNNSYMTMYYQVIRDQYSSALKSLGTLGGGNHFIEIQKGSDDHIWIMIHSGSRNLGKQVADFYNDVAKKLNRKWFSAVPEKYDLAFLPLDSKEGENYLREMQYCVDYALANRKLMMDRIIEIFEEVVPLHADDFVHSGCLGQGCTNISFEPIINIAHNYARLENHFGANVVIHRKGATLATEDTVGIIPGSQGTKSYIVKGKANGDAFNSCSHGAGRKMGRKDAEKRLDLKEEMEKLDSQGILHAMRGKHDLDEAPGAYKDIDVVMKNQEDLVEILVELTPLAVVKG